MSNHRTDDEPEQGVWMSLPTCEAKLEGADVARVSIVSIDEEPDPTAEEIAADLSEALGGTWAPEPGSAWSAACGERDVTRLFVRKVAS